MSVLWKLGLFHFSFSSSLFSKVGIGISTIEIVPGTSIMEIRAVLFLF